MMYERIALIYIPNDFQSTFNVEDPTKKKGFEFKKSVITRLECFYPWMLERGTFYKVYMDCDSDRVDLERILGFLSALDIPAFVVRDFDAFISDEIPDFGFEDFARHLLPIWFSLKMSSMFDKKNMISIDDFSSCPIHFCANPRIRCVNEIDTFSRFVEIFSDFLITYKGIESKRFYVEEDDIEDDIEDEEDLPW